MPISFTCPHCGVIVVAALVVVLAALLLRAMRAAREAARRAQCIKQMMELGVAMHNYHALYGSFPPAYLADEDGKPMHSWRVLLLPWLEEKGLYDQYRFEEPWDSPHNMAIGKMIGGYFRCPSVSEGVNLETNYMMIVGSETISDGASVTQFRDITDGYSHTILLVEVANSGVHWLEPRDLDASQMSFEITPASGTEVGSCHPGIANVLMCDGSVRSVGDDTSPELIRAMSTIAGGEHAVPLGGRS
jgi:prepilin-type processing-associated H-X9-DG protein